VGDRWYARPLVFVRDVDHARAFYVGDLGFKEDWRYAEDEQLLIVQVSRSGCELILTQQWPEKAGSSVMFVSLDEDELAALEARGVAPADGHWGYDLKIFTDPDGNQLWFPLPSD
jgi:catechol 2,3-dioxygenase-like lactoylglutathione lyase family enzyme